MDRPIGMFDSGFGGLTVARAVIDLLPDENLVYIGDTGRYPYGPRPQAEELSELLSLDIGQGLLERRQHRRSRRLQPVVGAVKSRQRLRKCRLTGDSAAESC